MAYPRSPIPNAKFNVDCKRSGVCTFVCLRSLGIFLCDQNKDRRNPPNMSQTHAVGGFIRTSRQAVNFIEAFADDLRFVGLRPRISVRKDALKLVGPTHEFNPSEYAKIGDKIRSRRLWDQREAIRAFETSSLRLLFVDGNEIDPQHIRPKVEVCRTDAEFATHRYCRLQQSVPSGPRVGRRIAALIYDVGQNRRALMGAIMLASPLYSVRARDAFLGWANRKLVKDAGLKRTMDLSLCMALPPYNELLAGKLMATLAVSSTMSKEFSTRYDDHLLAVTTTSATGLHCPIFNRIMIRPGGLYRRIGETTGYTTMILGDLTLHAARELIKVHRLARNQDITLWNT